MNKGSRAVPILLFLLLLVCYSYFLPRWQDMNQNSRLDMVVAVVDDGTFQIDKYYQNTTDYAHVNGHYYSDKAPGTAFVGIPVYAALRRALDLPVMGVVLERLNNNEALKATLRQGGSGLLEEKVRFAIAQVALTFAAAALPSALLAVLMYLLLGRFTRWIGPRLLVVLGYALLTPAFTYANAFYGHQLTTFCLFAAFYMLFMARDPIPAGRLLGAGFLLGYSVFTEYPSALVVVVITAYAAYRLAGKERGGWPRLGWLAAPGALVAAGLLLYNKAVFGSFFDLGYGHSELWMGEHSQGFMSITRPTLEAAWGITFSPFRGLFLLSPLLLLAFPGFVLWWRSKQQRAAWWVAAVSSALVFLFNISSVMWWGGFAVGPRYALPMVPFLALPVVFVFLAWGQHAWLRALAVVLYLWSFAATWGMTLAEQGYPPDTIRNPYVDFMIPNWLAGNIARNLGMFAKLPGVWSLAPLLIVGVVMVGGMAWLGRGSAFQDAAIRDAEFEIRDSAV